MVGDDSFFILMIYTFIRLFLESNPIPAKKALEIIGKIGPILSIYLVIYLSI